MENVILTLCTGNFLKIGIKKLETANLINYFDLECSGFATFIDRADILKNNIQNAEKKFGKFEKIFHIGDAKQDIQAALDNNIIPIAVCTGKHKNINFPQPCYIFENLEINFNEFLNLIK